MRLAGLILSGMCLSPLSNIRAIATPPRPSAPPPGNNISAYQIVYRGDYRDPSRVRDAGGFRPNALGWQSVDRVYTMDHHYQGGPRGCNATGQRHVTAYVSVVVNPWMAASYGRWIYEIRATPNFFLSGSSTDYNIYALGGVQWRQIRRYGLTNQESFVEEMLQGNPEYEENLYDFSHLAPLCHVRSDFPYQLQSGEPDTSISSSSDNKRKSQRERYPARCAANETMRSTEMLALVGPFPHTRRQWRFNMHRPHSSAPAEPEISSGEQIAARELQSFIDMGPERLNEMYPYGGTVVEELLRSVPWSACASVALSYKWHGPRQVEPPPSNASGQHESDGCCRAATVLRNKIADLPGAVLRTCTRLSALKFGIQLSDSWLSGTWDTLILAFGDGEAHKIASSPGRGFHEWQNISMQRTFKSDVVALDHLTRIRIFQEPTSVLVHDKWDLVGVKLKARCADSLTELHLDKLQSENIESFRPVVRHGVAWLAWSNKIDPKKDWVTHIDCSHFKAIEIELRLAKSSKELKLEDLFLSFVNEGIGRNTVTARTKSFNMDNLLVTQLKRTFSRSPVPVRDIKYFGVYSHAQQAPIPSWWKTIGLTVKGYCAGSNNVALFDKYAKNGEKFERKDSPSDDRHEVLMEDWRWATAETEAKAKTHEPSENWLFGRTHGA
ncbi:hypothetical protein Purlil1_1931 [Purpureocillium lilacinum]|uniref:Heat-labile enterotoxin alpha chain domain-containing protein n=1 Tax=Purpureocillium lilacinum TaxID=33203 RepID=A0ABR0CBN7_PURLI|nr:hypothetical protein Purlil1_1931 [Purpureocillium lilacinum]